MSSRMVMLQFGEQLMKMLDMLALEWGIETDEKAEFTAAVLASAGLNLLDLDQQIAIGVQNGCPAEVQVSAIRKMFGGAA